MTKILHFAEVFARPEDLDEFMHKGFPIENAMNLRLIATWDEIDEDG